MNPRPSTWGRAERETEMVQNLSSGSGGLSPGSGGFQWSTPGGAVYQARRLALGKVRRSVSLCLWFCASCMHVQGTLTAGAVAPACERCGGKMTGNSNGKVGAVEAHHQTPGKTAKGGYAALRRRPRETPRPRKIGRSEGEDLP